MKQLRLYVRLVTSYIGAHKAFFFLGIITSIGLIFLGPKIFPLLSPKKTRVIGLAGNYTLSSLPLEVQDLISTGLTKIGPDGQATSSAALSWFATDSGKLVTFTLDPNLTWQDGTKFSSATVNYNLKSVTLSHPDADHVAFFFKEAFAPLAVTLSQPLFKNGLVGLGNYQVQSIKFNGRFVTEINLQSVSSHQPLTYKFYPLESQLVTAFNLGAINEIHGLRESFGLEQDSHNQVSAATAGNIIVTMFFNTQKAPFDDKQFRQSLAYTLPNQYPGFEKAYAPFPLNSWFAGTSFKKYPQDLAPFKKSENITISTQKGLEPLGEQIASVWNKLGLKAKVAVTDIIPDGYDVYLTYLELPVDPDQYLLWHSTQATNISHYKSPKIDKLLEDGRQTLDTQARKSIYADFQKAITEEVPAVFLYYPKIYTVVRK
ncbi:MAG: ABC transporter substrate-binding protein [Patescibacteria group bacterium]|nr:ABC transporter substrate-binding protein [Patescibacteria group bacterium]MCL5431857.1 ABC transporter substrate-binding protein [Patescibacteria group bacterium]